MQLIFSLADLCTASSHLFAHIYDSLNERWQSIRIAAHSTKMATDWRCSDALIPAGPLKVPTFWRTLSRLKQGRFVCLDMVILLASMSIDKQLTFIRDVCLTCQIIPTYLNQTNGRVLVFSYVHVLDMYWNVIWWYLIRIGTERDTFFGTNPCSDTYYYIHTYVEYMYVILVHYMYICSRYVCTYNSRYPKLLNYSAQAY